MSDALYNTDALAWGERQSDLLARLARGERLNADIDWEHVVEEIRDVGLSELKRCESLLARAMTHLLKMRAMPDNPAHRHWGAEVVAFLGGARRNFTPSMRQRIDLADLYAEALAAARIEAPGVELPAACPFTQDELLAAQPDVFALVGRLALQTSA